MPLTARKDARQKPLDEKGPAGSGFPPATNMLLSLAFLGGMGILPVFSYSLLLPQPTISQAKVAAQQPDEGSAAQRLRDRSRADLQPAFVRLAGSGKLTTGHTAPPDQHKQKR
jgi:hypothetical protein